MTTWGDLRCAIALRSSIRSRQTRLGQAHDGEFQVPARAGSCRCVRREHELPELVAGGSENQAVDQEVKVWTRAVRTDELGEAAIRAGLVDLVQVIGAAIAAGIAVDVRRIEPVMHRIVAA